MVSGLWQMELSENQKQDSVQIQRNMTLKNIVD